MSTKLKKKTHRSYVFGDFDKDNIPNIDDKYPFDPKKSEQVEEIRLSDELKIIEEHREEFEEGTLEVRDDLKKLGFPVKHRIKSLYSMINKLRRKHLDDIKDVGGVMVLVDNVSQAYDVGKYIQGKYNVVEFDDYYKQPKTGYRALHYTIVDGGRPVEIQVKTKTEHDLHMMWHTAYKKGEFKPPNTVKYV